MLYYTVALQVSRQFGSSLAVRPSECRQRPAKKEQVEEEDGISDKNRSGFPR